MLNVLRGIVAYAVDKICDGILKITIAYTTIRAAMNNKNDNLPK